MEDQDKFYEAGRKLDPLFGHVIRDFQPTIFEAIEMISIHAQPYDPPNGRRRYNFSLRPDLVTEIQGMAADHDMPASAMVDLLLRVGLGDWHEWWNTHGGEAGPLAADGEEVDS